MASSSHISTSGGLLNKAFIDNARELGTPQRGFEPHSFALPWSAPPRSPAALSGRLEGVFIEDQGDCTL